MSRLSWEQTWQASDKETNMGLKIIRETGGHHALAARGDKFWNELGTFQTLSAAQHAAEACLAWRPPARS
jgi:L-fucose isomerase-like protein